MSVQKSNAKLKASDPGVKRLRDSTFGMSIHWGPYSMMNK